MANAAPAVPATPGFLNIINLMMNHSEPDGRFTSVSVTPEGSPVNAPASPAQIADAMIRSMLGSGSTNLMPLNPALVAVPGEAAANVNPPAAAKDNPNQAPRKQTRTIVDLPVVTVATAPVQTPIVPAPPLPPSANAPAASNTPVTAGTQESPVPVASARQSTRNQPEAKVAFTAILTPMNDAPAESADAVPVPITPEAAKPSINAAAPSAAPVVAVNSASPAPSTQGVTQSIQHEQAANAQQNSGASSQHQSSQQNDSPETPAKPIAISPESKIKPAMQQADGTPEAPAVVHSAAIPSIAADVTRPAATQSNAPAPEATPYSATAEALRTTESNLAPATARTGVAQEISIRISPADSPAVDLRVVERAGQVHVDVRTADSAMQSSLRQDLGNLTNSLERAGYHTETFIPSQALGRAASSAETGHQDNQQDPSQNRGGSGDSSGGRRQQQQQQKRPGTWLEEFEEQS
jgi:Flagellar hook-length control protein FliK